MSNNTIMSRAPLTRMLCIQPLSQGEVKGTLTPAPFQGERGKNLATSLQLLSVRCFIAGLMCWLFTSSAVADWPAPVLKSVFPAGGKAGETVTVAVQGALDGLTSLRFADGSGLVAEKSGENEFRVTIPADAPPGAYDVRAVTAQGITSARPFVVGRLNEIVETEPNNDVGTATTVAVDSTVNGKITPHGDVDVFSFAATAGQRVVVECFAERLDAPLHGVLELYDAAGKKLASNRGYIGVDPLVDVVVPADGSYTVKLFDLTYTGGEERIYRLDIDTQPRVEFAFPPVVQRGAAANVTLFGRNLDRLQETAVAANANVVDLENGTTPPASATTSAVQRSTQFDQLAVSISPPTRPRLMALRTAPPQLAADAFAYHHPGVQSPIAIGLTDVPVVLDAAENHSPDRAQEVEFPCEVAGRLAAGSEQDWYAIDVERGDVLWIAAFGERIGSPVDLALSLVEASGTTELLHLGDVSDHQQKPGYPANHADPEGRWFAPAAGRYLIVVRNVIGGSRTDERRIYRLSLRREEPAFAVVTAYRQPEVMSGFNLRRGERGMLDVLVERRRGESGPIRITAENLPAGVECPPVWIGPGTERAPLVVTCTRDTPAFAGRLQLVAENALGERRDVRGMMLVRPGERLPERRVTDDVAFAVVAADAPVSLTATLVPVGFEGELAMRDGDPVVYQGAVIDVLLTADRQFVAPAAISLSAAGLPDAIENQFATIAANERQAWISLYLPKHLPPGPYTIALQGTTEIPTAYITPGKDGQTSMSVVSNPISFYVDEARIDVKISRSAPKKIARGQVLTVDYSAKGLQGFVGKIHTEPAAPGGIVGIRGRGVTFVDGTETGTIQIIASDNAPLGKVPFLRLDAVGTVEDRQVYRGAQFLDLEITE